MTHADAPPGLDAFEAYAEAPLRSPEGNLFDLHGPAAAPPQPTPHRRPSRRGMGATLKGHDQRREARVPVAALMRRGGQRAIDLGYALTRVLWRPRLMAVMAIVVAGVIVVTSIGGGSGERPAARPKAKAVALTTERPQSAAAAPRASASPTATKQRTPANPTTRERHRTAQREPKAQRPPRRPQHRRRAHTPPPPMTTPQPMAPPAQAPMSSPAPPTTPSPAPAPAPAEPSGSSGVDAEFGFER